MEETQGDGDESTMLHIKISLQYSDTIYGTTALPESLNIPHCHFTICLLMTHNQGWMQTVTLAISQR